MKIHIKEYEIPVPIVTLGILALNLVVGIWTFHLSRIPPDPKVTIEIRQIESEYKREAFNLVQKHGLRFSQSGRPTGTAEAIRQFQEEYAALDASYRERFRPVLAKLPYYDFIFRYGVNYHAWKNPAETGSRRRKPSTFSRVWNFAVSFLTCQYIHANLSHFFGNMLFLLLFGLTIEIEVRSRCFLLFYHLAGVISSMTQILLMPEATSILLGASGAIAAVMGGFLIVAPTAKISLGWIFGWLGFLMGRVSAAAFLLIWIGFQYLNGVVTLQFGVTGGVAWFAHIGGFSMGILWLLGRDAFHFLKS